MMLPGRLRATLILAILLFYIIVLALLKRRRLTLKYTLLWMMIGLVMLVLALFPQILARIAKLLGIQSVMNTLYVLALAFILMLIMMLTSIVSAQTDRIRRLAQSQALLEERDRQAMKRVEELEEELRKSGVYKEMEFGHTESDSAAAEIGNRDVCIEHGNMRGSREMK